VSREISFIKNEFQKLWPKNTKTKLASLFYERTDINASRKKLWQVVDNKRTKTKKDKNIKTTNDIAIGLLGFILILEIMFRMEIK